MINMLMKYFQRWPSMACWFQRASWMVSERTAVGTPQLNGIACCGLDQRSSLERRTWTYRLLEIVALSLTFEKRSLLTPLMRFSNSTSNAASTSAFPWITLFSHINQNWTNYQIKRQFPVT